MIILGAGKQAELVLELIEWNGRTTAGLRFFDDRAKTGGVGPRGLRVSGTLADGIHLAIESKRPTLVAMGSRTAALRQWLRGGLERRGVPLPNLIHSSTIMAPTAKFGVGVTVFAGCIFAPNVRVESGAIVFNGCTLEHDTVIGENAWVAPGVTTSGFVKIGAHCFIGAGCVLSRESQIGQGTLVGAGAVVVRDLPEFIVAFGVPAKPKGPLCRGMDAPTAEDLAACATGPLAFLA